MAVKYTIAGPYTVCFPTKLRAASCGHILNLTLQQDLENGTIRSAGDWIELDNYEDAAPASGNGAAVFQGVIRGKSARGNYYVEVTADTTDLLVYQEPVPAETNFTKPFTVESAWINEEGDVVRAYTLCKYDIFEVSKEAFTTTPTAASIGKPVTANANGKLVIGS